VSFASQLREVLEKEERETVGKAFGGTTDAQRTSFSVATVRDHLLSNPPYVGESAMEKALNRAHGLLSTRQFKIVAANLIRYSFLIELTNLTVGSTKMKTRWLPGRILMPQEGSYEPVRGTFEPGNDPRAASFEECVRVFIAACNTVCDEVTKNPPIKGTIEELNSNRRVPYEFLLSYKDPLVQRVHTASNVSWAFTNDLQQLLAARAILKSAPAEHKPALRELVKAKIQVKVFKTDRALTGKDKTNRAKRWEVLAGDFQHATLEQCWSAERKLTSDLAAFHDFPRSMKDAFVASSLISPNAEPTRCPVTLELLSFAHLSESLLSPTHGVSQYQVGHLHPLKRGGNHDGGNVCWQSANGNRIQGDLSIEETTALLDAIAARRASL